MNKKIELLSPAGSLEKLKIAILYGADAVYMAGQDFSLRAYADNFTFDEMKQGVEFTHKRGKKVYITANIYPRDHEADSLKNYLISLSKLDIDGIIVSDPGVLSMVKRILPNICIHLSTQANCTGSESANFWYEQGVRRIVLARELSLDEIKIIRENTPIDLELEAFAHGAMCVSYSGRCLLSNFMTERDSNRGMCAQPCRWEYGLVEGSRPGEVYGIEEDSRGTYIMNSRDLCMIEHIDGFISAGISSLKIEGRMKSAYYTAVVTRAYRGVIDAYDSDVLDSKIINAAVYELNTVSHRPYTTGFFIKGNNEKTMEINKGGYIREFEFIGVVKGYDNEAKRLIIEQRNRFFNTDDIEIVTPNGEIIKIKLNKIIDEKGQDIEAASHAKMTVYIDYDIELPVESMIRKSLYQYII